MSSLQLFAERGLKGESVTLRSDTPTLSNLSGDQPVKPPPTNAITWVVFTGSRYTGTYSIHQGEQSSMPSTAQAFRGGLQDPEIIIFQYTQFRGQNLKLTGPTGNFDHYGFEGKGLSDIVLKGAWILYEEKDFSGRSRVVIAGNQTRDYYMNWWKGRVNSARPVTEQDIGSEFKF